VRSTTQPLKRIPPIGVVVRLERSRHMRHNRWWFFPAVIRGHSLAARSVLVVDDDAGFRRFVEVTLDRIGLAAAEASDGAEALRAARAERPALVVIDVRLPDLNGFEVFRQLRDELGEHLPVLLVSGEKMDDLDRSAGLLLGADDYLVKPVDPSLFIARVRRLVSQQETEARANGHVALGRGVTPREREVLALLAQGDGRAEIARKLVISPRTVGSHIQRLLGKFGVHSQAQVVAAAYREGLIEPASSNGSRATTGRGSRTT
jgi:DNA-binding NarL/FixJ family response regulator